jgi:hypothetical protein
LTAIEPQGSRIIKGTGAPDPGVGTIGDYWLDSTDIVLYGPKSQAGWGEGIPLNDSGFSHNFDLSADQDGNAIVYDEATSLWTGKPVRYTHVQSTASDAWVVEHNLGVHPGGVSVVDSGDSVVYGNVVYIDSNTLNIIFTAPFGGKAYVC